MPEAVSSHLYAYNVKFAWIKALEKVILYGRKIKTEYGDLSLDRTVMIEILHPLSTPIKVRDKVMTYTSKYGNEWKAYGHEGDLLLTESIKNGYIEEVLEGKLDDKIGHGERYTYHDRLRGDYDQIQRVVEKLRTSPITRRAQAITWRPHEDQMSDEPPCLQRIWCRVMDGKLYMQTHWRSRDLFKAWAANTNAMLQLMKRMAEDLEVEMGTYVDLSNSLHLYGTYYDEICRFLETTAKRSDKQLERLLDAYKEQYNE